ncbi:MAG: type II secretion system protein GspK [Tepidisphaeraceae bacterium]
MSRLPKQSRRNRGTVLIVAMVVVFAIAAMVLSLTRQVGTQSLVSANDLAVVKADAAERGAEQYVLSLLTDYRDSLPTMTETEFSAVPVGDAYFWIVRPTFNDTNTPAWGLTDESGKMSLNTASASQIMTLPGMTEDLGLAIQQWRGQTDTTTTTDGTTSSSSSSSTGTVAVTDGVKNAPFETVDELMMIPGMTHELLHGLPASQAAALAANGGSTDWYQTHGVFDYFTAWGQWPNTAADGTARVSYNAAEQRDALNTLLSDKLGSAARASEIINIITPATGGGRGRPGRATPVQLTDIFDLADRANLTTEELAAIEDYVTNDSQATLVKGRINVNTAPREVLLTLPNLAESDVDTLIARRVEAAASDTPNSVAWVYDALKDKAVGLGNLICGQGRQFSADIVAVSHNGRAFKRVRIVVDSTSSPARVVYRRDLTDQGWPMDPSILDQLKAGTFAGGQTPTMSSATGAR